MENSNRLKINPVFVPSIRNLSFTLALISILASSKVESAENIKLIPAAVMPVFGGLLDKLEKNLQSFSMLKEYLKTLDINDMNKLSEKLFEMNKEEKESLLYELNYNKTLGDKKITGVYVKRFLTRNPNKPKETDRSEISFKSDREVVFTIYKDIYAKDDLSGARAILISFCKKGEKREYISISENIGEDIEDQREDIKELFRILDGISSIIKSNPGLYYDKTGENNTYRMKFSQTGIYFDPKFLYEVKDKKRKEYEKLEEETNDRKVVEKRKEKIKNLEGMNLLSSDNDTANLNPRVSQWIKYSFDQKHIILEKMWKQEIFESRESETLSIKLQQDQERKAIFTRDSLNPQRKLILEQEKKLKELKEKQDTVEIASVQDTVEIASVQDTVEIASVQDTVKLLPPKAFLSEEEKQYKGFLDKAYIAYLSQNNINILEQSVEAILNSMDKETRLGAIFYLMGVSNSKKILEVKNKNDFIKLFDESLRKNDKKLAYFCQENNNKDSIINLSNYDRLLISFYELLSIDRYSVLFTDIIRGEEKIITYKEAMIYSQRRDEANLKFINYLLLEIDPSFTPLKNDSE